jgi:hypothetical protein
VEVDLHSARQNARLAPPVPRPLKLLEAPVADCLRVRRVSLVEVRWDHGRSHHTPPQVAAPFATDVAS